MPGGYLHKGWQPLEQVPEVEWNPAMQAYFGQHGVDPAGEVWLNDRYQVIVRFPEGGEDAPTGRDGLIWLSLHTLDRSPVRNWRHLQQIKNEIAGEERWAMEIFPPEEYLADSANEYHIYVMPLGTDVPFAFHERLVPSDEQVERFNDAPHKGRQEPWEPGLTTGGDRSESDPLLESAIQGPPS